MNDRPLGKDELEQLAARAARDEDAAVELLVRVADSLPQELLVEAAGRLPGASPRATAELLEVLAERLPRRARRPLIREVLGEPTSAVGVGVAAELAPDLHADALAAAAAIPSEHLRSEILVALAPRLSEKHLTRAAKLAAAIESPVYRAQVRGALACRLPEPRRQEAFTVALAEIAAGLESADDGERSTIELELSLPRVSKPDRAVVLPASLAVWAEYLAGPQLERALDLVAEFRLPALRLAGRAALSRALPEKERAELLRRVLEEAEPLAPGDRLKVVAAMAPHLPASLRPEVRDRLEKIGDPDLVREAAPRLGLPPEVLPKDARPAGLGAVPLDFGVTPARLPSGIRSLPVGDRIGLGQAAIAGLGKVASLVRHATLPDGERIVARLRERVDAEPERVVSTGFAGAERPQQPRSDRLPLATGERYHFWLEIGPPAEGSVEETPTAIDLSELPARARLTVALFPVSGASLFAPGAAVGELELGDDGRVRVVAAPSRPEALDPGAEILERRLFFPFTSPRRAGSVEFRCSIYHRQTLLQSRLVRARVMRRPTPRRGALVSRLDFSLSRSLDAGHLHRFPEQRLSVFLNRGADGSHTFSFLGAGGEADGKFVESASLSADELQNQVDLTRGILRQVAWGDDEPWEDGKTFRYLDGGNHERLEGDLIDLALRGYKLYDGLVSALAGGEERAEELAGLMRRQGTVQISFRERAADVVPASIFYDHPLDTAHERADYRICPSFKQAARRRLALADTPCFDGDCPARDRDDANADLNLVCPSGFWGYRHALGMPASVASSDAAPEIVLDGGVRVGACVYPGFALVAEHQRRLRELRPDLDLRPAADRKAAFRVMADQALHLLYFYCHGGESKSVPFLVLGPSSAGGSSTFITPDNLRARRIRWTAPRPLVFLNGCHTTALRPEQALQFIRPFVEYSHAAGVIGTEITIFEKLATRFAEVCLRRFLVDGEPIGQAVRGARLDLLQEGNPLGLVYIPFVHAGLRVVEGGSGGSGSR